MLRIGLIGDRDDAVTAHVAIPKAIALAAKIRNVEVEQQWLTTNEINLQELIQFHGLWCVPASPYRDTDRAIRAIQFAREQRIPFLGTCGGFQHAIIEYARNVLGITDADHAELSPDAAEHLISPLACELVDKSEYVSLRIGSLLHDAYGCESSTEGYHCRYGLNPEFESQITSDDFRIAAVDSRGAVRALELRDHPFFVLTLFQPERESLNGDLPPIVCSFIKHSAIYADEQHVAPESRIRANWQWTVTRRERMNLGVIRLGRNLVGTSAIFFKRSPLGRNVRLTCAGELCK